MGVVSEGGFSLKKLQNKFVARRVRITSIGDDSDVVHGICKDVYEQQYGVDIELANGNHYSVIPDELTETYVEGVVGYQIKVRRRIEFV